MSKEYIVISDSASNKSKRFRVIQGGWKNSLSKKESINEVIGGGLDIAVGSIYETNQYMFRVRHTEEDSNYGTKDDLEYFFRLNDPAPATGNPNNLITIVDHYGTTKHGYLVGNLCPDPVTTIIDGIYAWFMIQVEIRIKPE